MYLPFPRENLILLMDLRVNNFLSHISYIGSNLIMQVIKYIYIQILKTNLENIIYSLTIQ